MLRGAEKAFTILCCIITLYCAVLTVLDHHIILVWYLGRVLVYSLDTLET